MNFAYDTTWERLDQLEATSQVMPLPWLIACCAVGAISFAAAVCVAFAAYDISVLQAELGEMKADWEDAKNEHDAALTMLADRLLGDMKPAPVQRPVPFTRPNIVKPVVEPPTVPDMPVAPGPATQPREAVIEREHEKLTSKGRPLEKRRLGDYEFTFAQADDA